MYRKKKKLNTISIYTIAISMQIFPEPIVFTTIKSHLRSYIFQLEAIDANKDGKISLTELAE